VTATRCTATDRYIGGGYDALTLATNQLEAAGEHRAATYLRSIREAWLTTWKELEK
jgi:hypothetical protein